MTNIEYAKNCFYLYVQPMLWKLYRDHVKTEEKHYYFELNQYIISYVQKNLLMNGTVIAIA